MQKYRACSIGFITHINVKTQRFHRKILIAELNGVHFKVRLYALSERDVWILPEDSREKIYKDLRLTQVR